MVPAHWPLEIVNSLLIAQRRGRVTNAQVSDFLNDLAGLPIRVAGAVASAQWPTIAGLARQHRLTAYDASYLELAQRSGLPLATLDADLRKAAVAAGAALV
jgi:predicted nucleic acid-binding protein